MDDRRPCPRGPKAVSALSALDAHNALQVETFAPLSDGELRRKLAAVGPRAVRMRRRTPAFVRRQGTERYFPGEPLVEPTLAYVLDVLSPRDTWLHRLEIARATDRPFAADPHQESVVAQVVRDLAEEWASPPLVLELDGAGQWRLGEGEPIAWVRASVLEYLWHLSGRPGNPEFDVDGDPAAVDALRAARVVF